MVLHKTTHTHNHGPSFATTFATTLNIALTLSIEIKNSSVPHKSTGCPKKGGSRISALYVFYCAMWAFRGLPNIFGGSYIKIKYCQALSKAFH